MLNEQRSHVPKFGNWESEENVPYTAFFDKARKGRTSGGKMINPNDPQENPDLLNYNSASTQGPTSRGRAEPAEPIRQGAGISSHEQGTSREDGDLRQFPESPAHNDNLGTRATNESAYQRHGGRGVGPGEANRRPSRHSTGSEHSIERSPLHRQARASARDSGVNSPSWEGRTSYDSTHGTPGRSRMKPVTRGDETPEKGAAVPKFGEWDENNPASADGFTHIFNKVREERQSGVGRAPGPNETPYANTRRQEAKDSVKSCCFPWGRK
nr:RPM1-interacting protein 4-like isoform X1 [Quercus suber]